MTNPTEAQNAEQSTMSRREVLRRAGWAVPAIVALPLIATPANASKRSKYASPGGKYSSYSRSRSPGGKNPKKWKPGGFLDFFKFFKF